MSTESNSQNKKTGELESTAAIPAIKRAKPVRLFEQAVEQIRSLILNGHLKPGDRLPSENQLSKMLDVSRSSVREALRSLESKGIITVKSGSGAFVAEDALVFSSMNDAMLRIIQRKDSLLQLLEVRTSMECLSASLAAQSNSAKDLKVLSKIVDRQAILDRKKNNSEKINELAMLDAKFHVKLSEIGGNELVYEILNALVPAFSEDNKAIFVVEDGHKLVEEHRQILDALNDHDPLRAEAKMKEHLDRVKREIQEIQRIGQSPPG